MHILRRLYYEFTGQMLPADTVTNVPNSNMDYKSNLEADKPTNYYNLDMIISVGYRLKSQRGIIFRQWATKILKDYMLKGYAVNQKRLEYL